MRTLYFNLLYVACLLACLAVVEVAKAGFAPRPEPELPPQAVEDVIAVPPKPKGVDLQVGEGDGEGDEYIYTEEACREHAAGQYRDICFHQLARQRAPTDLPGALGACDEIPPPRVKGDPDTLFECQSDVAELHAPSDLDAALAVCPSIPWRKWRDQCQFGISLAMRPSRPRWAFQNCDNAGKWHLFCRHDVNGEIAQSGDLEMAVAHCLATEGSLLKRSTCWHGISKYIGRVSIDDAFAACDRVPDAPEADGAQYYREQCYHGLGWAGAEQEGLGFMPTCARAAAFRDSCLLGIAYHERRLSIDNGLTACAEVVRADLKEQCEQMVREGSINQ